jgi:LPPG:FO 2-phospho-L-lactate transferase
MSTASGDAVDSVRIVALSGGVGGAKLAQGLAQVLAPEALVIVCNTADDFEHMGLRICPDIDSVMYALAGRNDPERGWGLAHETWAVMEALRAFDGVTWFQLGDKDLATHLSRTHLLRQGRSLGEATSWLCQRLGIKHSIWPMSDDPVATFVRTAERELPFQEYFVRERCAPIVRGFRYAGAEQARPHAGLMRLLEGNRLDAVIVCPSNPFLSVDPILALPGMRDALLATSAPIVAVSPVVGGRALKGPLAKLLEELGQPVNTLSIARHYNDLLDGFVIDTVDRDEEAAHARSGLATLATQTVMSAANERRQLADDVLRFARALRDR